MMGKAHQPWDKFFWSDYDADEGLRMCSLAAQGLWMRMLCIMARATPKGELRIAGDPCTVADIARAVSEREETVSTLLDELRRRGVLEQSRTGVIYNRRMVNAREKSRKMAKNGQKGGVSNILKNNENRNLLGSFSKQETIPHMPYARSQKERSYPEEGFSLPRERTRTPEPERTPDPAPDRTPTAECWLRGLVETEPVVLDPNPRPVLELLDQGMTRADIAAGIAAALAKPEFRPRHWGQFVGWIRRSAKDRMAGQERPSPGDAAGGGSDPRVDFGGGYVWPESTVAKAVERWRLDPRSWPAMIGPSPGEPGCRVPARLIAREVDPNPKSEKTA